MSNPTFLFNDREIETEIVSANLTRFDDGLVTEDIFEAKNLFANTTAFEAGVGETDALVLTGGDDLFVFDDATTDNPDTINGKDRYAQTQGEDLDRIRAIDFVYAGHGNDVVDFTTEGKNSDIGVTVFAGEGDDLVWTGGGADALFGGSASDTLFGGAGDDMLGGAGAFTRSEREDKEEEVHEADGADTLIGGDGNDALAGDAGDDVLYGDDKTQPGKDESLGKLLKAEEERATEAKGEEKPVTNSDVLWGGEGSDVLYGGQDTDYLYGGGGSASNDTLAEWTGKDSKEVNTLAGGEGSDWYYVGRDDGQNIIVENVDEGRINDLVVFGRFAERGDSEFVEGLGVHENGHRLGVEARIRIGLGRRRYRRQAIDRWRYRHAHLQRHGRRRRDLRHQHHPHHHALGQRPDVQGPYTGSV